MLTRIQFLVDPSSVGRALASIAKALGSVSTMVRHIFQPALCGYGLRVAPQTSGRLMFTLPEFWNSLVMSSCVSGLF